MILECRRREAGVGVQRRKRATDRSGQLDGWTALVACPGFVRISDKPAGGWTIRTIAGCDSRDIRWRAACLGMAAFMTARPHDALFKAAFEVPAAAAVLLRARLAAEVGDAIAWDTLCRDHASFVDAALLDSHSDLLFSARLRTSDTALIYFLLEHQSTGDPAMPLRGLSYQVRIWERSRKEQPQACLPLVIAVIVSHAPDGWTTSRALEDMLDPAVRAQPQLATLAPQFSLLIEDLAYLSDADLVVRSLAAFQKLALWLLRDARDPARLLDSFGTWSSAMVELLTGPEGSELFATLTRYMFLVVDPVHRELLRAKIRLLGPRAEEIAMTIAEQLIEEGRQEGRQEGSQVRGITILRRLLVFKFKLQTLDPAYEAQLQAAAPEAVDRYLERVLTADSLAAVFAD